MSVFLCGICQKDYNEDARKPLSLPCGHVLCQDCLSSNTKENGSGSGVCTIKCPSDSKYFKLEFQKIPICYQILTNLPKKKDHHVLDSHIPIRCVRHPAKKIKYFCKTHNIFPCSICVVDHMSNGQHELEPFTANMETFSNEIKAISTIIENEYEDAVQTQNQAEKSEKQTIEYYKTQIRKVDATFEKLFEALKEKQKSLTNSLRTSLNEHQKKIDTDKNSIAIRYQKLSKLKQRLKGAYEYHTSKNYEDFNIVKQELTKKIKELSTLESTFDKTELPFAYYASNVKVDEMTGSIKYFKNLKDVENRHRELKIEKSKERVNKKVETPKSNSDKYENIFQDNLLKDKQVTLAETKYDTLHQQSSSSHKAAKLGSNVTSPKEFNKISYNSHFKSPKNLFDQKNINNLEDKKKDKDFSYHNKNIIGNVHLKKNYNLNTNGQNSNRETLAGQSINQLSQKNQRDKVMLTQFNSHNPELDKESSSSSKNISGLKGPKGFNMNPNNNNKNFNVNLNLNLNLNEEQKEHTSHNKKEPEIIIEKRSSSTRQDKNKKSKKRKEEKFVYQERAISSKKENIKLVKSKEHNVNKFKKEASISSSSNMKLSNLSF